MQPLLADGVIETWLTVGIVVHSISAFACSGLAEEKFANAGRAFLFGLLLGPWAVLVLGRMPARKPQSPISPESEPRPRLSAERG